MSYINLGYNNLLTKVEDGLSITSANEDSIVEDGSLTWGKVSQNGETPEAGATDNSGEIVDGVLITDVINARLDTANKYILSDFVFSPTDFAGALKTGTITWNTSTGAVTGGTGIVINKNGIVGASSGTTKFSIDTAGNATFSGDITGATGTFGSVTINSGSISWATISGTGTPEDNATVGATLGTNVSGGSTATNRINNSGYVTTITADAITTGTLTGRTVQTATSGSRVVMNGPSNYLQVYSGSTERLRLESDSLKIFDTNSNQVGRLFGDTGLTLLESSSASYYLALKTPATSSLGILFLNGTTTIQQITSTGVIIRNGKSIYPSTAYNGRVGLTTNPWSGMHATSYYFNRSGYSEKYIQMAANGSSIDVNHNFYVGGTLSKSAGSFRIDHPLKPDTHYLQHSFVESPEMLNLYRGNAMIVNGECIVETPDWFIPLNGDNINDFSYQLTSIGQKNELWVKREMDSVGNITFAGEKDGKFSYIITGVRHDEYALENPIEVELKK